MKTPDQFDSNALDMYDLLCEVWTIGEKYIFISQGFKENCFVGKIVEVGLDYLQLDTGNTTRSGNIFIPFRKISYFRIVDSVGQVEKGDK